MMKRIAYGTLEVTPQAMSVPSVHSTHCHLGPHQTPRSCLCIFSSGGKAFTVGLEWYNGELFSSPECVTST